MKKKLKHNKDFIGQPFPHRQKIRVQRYLFFPNGFLSVTLQLSYFLQYIYIHVQYFTFWKKKKTGLVLEKGAFLCRFYVHCSISHFMFLRFYKQMICYVFPRFVDQKENSVLEQVKLAKFELPPKVWCTISSSGTFIETIVS